MQRAASTTVTRAPVPTAPPAGDLVWVAPATGWPGFDLPEHWRYRSILVLLVWREIKVHHDPRFALARPVPWRVSFNNHARVAAAVGAHDAAHYRRRGLFAIFGWFARLPSDGVPYSLFVLMVLVPWLVIRWLRCSRPTNFYRPTVFFRFDPAGEA